MCECLFLFVRVCVSIRVFKYIYKYVNFCVLCRVWVYFEFASVCMCVSGFGYV